MVVIGESQLVSCYSLAGARVLVAESPDDVADAWSRIPAGTTVAVMTKRAAAAPAGRRSARPELLQVVMDE